MKRFWLHAALVALVFGVTQTSKAAYEHVPTSEAAEALDQTGFNYGASANPAAFKGSLSLEAMAAPSANIATPVSDMQPVHSLSNFTVPEGPTIVAGLLLLLPLGASTLRILVLKRRAA